jgi:hypothetical protein
MLVSLTEASGRAGQEQERLSTTAFARLPNAGLVWLAATRCLFIDVAWRDEIYRNV